MCSGIFDLSSAACAPKVAPMSDDLPRDDAEALLDPHLTSLCEPIYAASRDWDALSPATRQPPVAPLAGFSIKEAGGSNRSP
jgi:hypothetical protein